MINGIGAQYNQIATNLTLNEQKVQADKASSSQKKEPEKLDALKEAISKGNYKLDMSKTTEAFMKHYA